MRRRLLTATFAVLLVLLGSAPVALAQETRSDTLFTVDKYLEYETVADPQISPDGSQIVYTRRWVNKLEDRWESSLWIMAADGSRNRFLVDGSDPTWAPDGTRIAYLADGEPEGTQLWVKYLDAEGATQVTRLEHEPDNIAWSPDSRQLGFTAFVPQTSKWTIDLPEPPEGAEWTKTPAVIERLHYRQDRVGFTDVGYTHLFVVPADGGTPRQLTRGEWNVGARFDQLAGSVGWDWSPAGGTIVIEGLREDDADLTYRDSHLYAVAVASGDVRQLTGERGSWSSPVFSPDGRSIAFTGYPYNTSSYRARDLYVMNSDGSAVRRLSAELDRDPTGLIWAADGSGIYFTAASDGTSNLYVAAPRGGVRQVTRGTHMLSLGSVARSGVAVGVRSAPHAPPDVVRIARSGEITQLTRVNDDLLAPLRLGEVEEIRYTSGDGTPIQGWVVKPPSFDPARTYPMIMEIHGGPHGMYNVGFNPMYQNFAANGFVVLYTNPRGSTGYGTEFGNAIERAYPSVDYDDLMAGVDALLAQGYVDAENLFVGGCSGGGVLSSWVIGHTNRFKAAAVRCPVTNWLSFLGQTDIPLFTQNFFERPFWEDPEPWLRQSPLMYVGHVETPTLLMTGVLDLRTPMPQTEEYYAALKLRGVSATLLRFEGEYHGTGSKPSNWMRSQLYMMSWYRRWGSIDAPIRATNP
ncbi:MAG: S9 family peptidase [Longimicrobiales bacterium]